MWYLSSKHPLPGKAIALVLELSLESTFNVTLVRHVISCFYVAIIKYLKQGNLLKKDFIQAYKSKWVSAIMEGSMENKMAGMTTRAGSQEFTSPTTSTQQGQLIRSVRRSPFSNMSPQKCLHPKGPTT